MVHREAMTLLQFVESQVEMEIWARYKGVKDFGPESLQKLLYDGPSIEFTEMPFDDPQAASLYCERRDLERLFVEIVKGELAAGRWILDAIEDREIKPQHIDGRLLQGGAVDFVENELRLSNGRWFSEVRLLSNLPMVPSIGRKSGCEQPSGLVKINLRRELKDWLTRLTAEGRLPQPRRLWFAEAQRHFNNPHLSGSLFQQVWKSLPPTHPLKLLGRPKEPKS